MGEKNPTIRERLAIVETELRHTNTSLDDLTIVVGAHKTSIDGRLDGLTAAVTGLTAVVDNKLQGSFSGKEKAMILTAIIAGVVSVVNTVLMLIKG